MRFIQPTITCCHIHALLRNMHTSICTGWHPAAGHVEPEDKELSLAAARFAPLCVCMLCWCLEGVLAHAHRAAATCAPESQLRLLSTNCLHPASNTLYPSPSPSLNAGAIWPQSRAPSPPFPHPWHIALELARPIAAMPAHH